MLWWGRNRSDVPAVVPCNAILPNGGRTADKPGFTFNQSIAAAGKSPLTSEKLPPTSKKSAFTSWKSPPTFRKWPQTAHFHLFTPDLSKTTSISLRKPVTNAVLERVPGRYFGCPGHDGLFFVSQVVERIHQLVQLPLRPNFRVQPADQAHGGSSKHTRSFGCFRGHGTQ
jgi:hypothetical protein